MSSQISYLALLHQRRQDKGNLRQPRYGNELYDLELVIRQMGLSHPYALIKNKTQDQFAQLEKEPVFAKGGQGPQAAPAQEYVFHLTNVRRVFRYTGEKKGSPNVFHQHKSDQKRFAYLMGEFGRRGVDWLQLSDYVHDEYSGYRGFTWWTNLKLLPNHIVCGAHRLGLPNVWIPKYALVMRCRADYVNGKQIAHIPTTLDAFISEIFSPVDCRTPLTPKYGETIDLDSGPLIAGAQEFGLSPIAVSEIEFYPVLIDRPSRLVHVVRRDARLWQLLEIYYNKL